MLAKWRYRTIFFVLLSLFFSLKAFSQSESFPRGTHEVTISNVKGVRAELLKNIAPIIEKSIATGEYPGAVVLASHHGQIIYRGVFGNRRILPNVAPMQFDTIFDLASLTKVLATTPAIMQLVEQGRIDLDAPVAKYWPQFAEHGKEEVTIRELLTHTAGLPALIPMEQQHGMNEALREVEKTKLLHAPGTFYLYSDVDFITLGHLVELITHQNFNQYVQEHILKPLGMKETFFLPAENLRDRIAPTEVIDNELRWGKVHDRVTYAIGGVSGSAGLFSTAHDISLYAQCLLNNGRYTQTTKHGKESGFLLGKLTILKMTTPQMSPSLLEMRGLGWDIDSPYSNRGVLFPMRSYGHTGWTGTSLWIDPATETWIIVLTSRTHPKPRATNEVVHDRRAIANIIAASITDVPNGNLNNTGQGELVRAYAPQPITQEHG